MNERRARYSFLVRLLFLSITIVLLGTFAPSRLAAPPLTTQPALISFTPIPLDEKAPQRARLGSLVFRGGWVLASDNPRFGGISAMEVVGGKVTAISDAGWLIAFPLPDRRTSVTGSVEALPDGPGLAEIKSQRDSESMVIAAGHAWIGFERQNAVWRYVTSNWSSDSHAKPPSMRRWPNNSGPEAMVRLPDGRFMVFSEAARRQDGSNEVLLFAGDPAVAGTKAISLGYRPPTGYSATDAVQLPDGRLLILNRRFRVLEGVSAKLVMAGLPTLNAGVVIQGREIADMRPPVAVDNMEALSLSVENGRTIIWMASDDNFNPLQRTLLMKFELDVPAR